MKITSLLFALLFSFCALSQDGYDWGPHKPSAQGKWYHVDKSVKAKQYTACVNQIHWLLENAPNLHVDLYKQATKVLQETEKVEKNTIRKTALQDSILWIFDKRMDLFGDTANVLNRKGLVAYKYKRNDADAVSELFNLYNTSYSLNKEKSYPQNILYWVLTASKAKKEDLLNENQFLEIFFLASDFVDENKTKHFNNPKKIAGFEKMQTQFETVLESTVQLDCEKIESIFGESFRANSENIVLAKKVFRLLKKAKCYKSDMLYSAIHTINIHQPSANGYITEAQIHEVQKDFTSALGAFENAIGLAKSEEQKADIYIKMADIYRAKGDKINARTNARKALATGFQTKKAYNLIGDLYLYSFNECKCDDVLQTRSIYIAAYEMYKKAGNTAKMNKAKENFPSAEDIFNLDKTEGDQISTGCWINDTVSLQKR
jgi:tetratricopeptide (TPR) repeat protein